MPHELKDDECKINVELHVYDSESNASFDNILSSYDCTKLNVETVVSKNASVAELKAILESQDLIPGDADELDIQVKLQENSQPLSDTSLIPESVDKVIIVIKPPNTSGSENAVSAQNNSVLISTPTPQNVSNRVESTTAANSGIPANTIESLFSSSMPFTVDNAFTDMTDTANFGLGDNFNAFSVNSPDMSRLLGHPVVRDMITNPEFLRAVFNADPRLRELRQRHPEFNHILNDSQLLKEAAEVMQSPSLMREMIGNTDRVLRNMDVVPGAFNNLRSLYETINEPIWEAAMDRDMVGIKGSDGKTKKVYDLQKSSGPNTDVIPSPWSTTPIPPASTQPSSQSRRTQLPWLRSNNNKASRQVRSTHAQKLQSISSSVATQPKDQSSSALDANNNQHQQDDINCNNNQTEHYKNDTNPKFNLDSQPDSRESIRSDALPNFERNNASNDYTTVNNSTEEKSAQYSKSNVIESGPQLDEKNMLKPENRFNHDSNSSEQQESSLSQENSSHLPLNSAVSVHLSSYFRSNVSENSGFVSLLPHGQQKDTVPQNNTRPVQDGTLAEPECTNCLLSSSDSCEHSQKDLSSEHKECFSSHDDRNHSRLSSTDQELYLSSSQSAFTHVSSSPSVSSKPSCRAAPSQSSLLPATGQYPYLYQSVFPSQHRLRSLGGLSLPHAAHIRGVIRQPSNTTNESHQQSPSSPNSEMSSANKPQPKTD